MIVPIGVMKMIYAAPNQPNSKIDFKPRYENFIGGELDLGRVFGLAI